MNIYLRKNDWARSIERHIDEETLIDLLKIVKYQSDRVEALQELGMDDHASPEDALFSYVLDALGVPPEGHEIPAPKDDESGVDVLVFSREWFEETYYQEFLLNNDEHQWDYPALIQTLKSGISSGRRDSHYRPAS